MLKTVKETLAMLAAEAEQLGYMTFVSGHLVISAEYHRKQIIWYVDDRRSTLEQASTALEKARAARHADHPSIA
ncbi:hypothetical protein R69608_01405 [Paraburkholderia nemoris]|uniref:hypothetical protein n=1 Tax=Paraburkholderia nemoris TaxID=2793076 RepID=UPI001914D827|nr:hypothetical protein [Paraburkholderia nemoris]MBK5148030.1 hypothetical protein [Burkholderia sp. R-69608]CAE6876025.1 hypothetical protein R69608_01405 [Paraburkholderia nemoris]